MDLDYRIVKDISWLLNTVDFFCPVFNSKTFAFLNNNIIAAKPKHLITQNAVRIGKKTINALKVFLPIYVKQT